MPLNEPIEFVRFVFPYHTREVHHMYRTQKQYPISHGNSTSNKYIWLAPIFTGNNDGWTFRAMNEPNPTHKIFTGGDDLTVGRLSATRFTRVESGIYESLMPFGENCRTYVKVHTHPPPMSKKECPELFPMIDPSCFFSPFRF